MKFHASTLTLLFIATLHQYVRARPSQVAWSVSSSPSNQVQASHSSCPKDFPHCVVLENAHVREAVVSDKHYVKVQCRNVDPASKNGGSQVCGMPESASSRIHCHYDRTSYVDVHFGIHQSTFTTHGTVLVSWGSQQRQNGGRQYARTRGWTTVHDDTLFVDCFQAEAA